MDVSEISDEGLKHLEGLLNLRRLHLEKTTVSALAKARLLKSIPSLKIVPERLCQPLNKSRIFFVIPTVHRANEVRFSSDASRCPHGN